MNDITALIESLKEPAKQAIELDHIKNYAKGRFAVLLFQSRATAANVLALIEALEKAQQRIAELERAAFEPVAWTEKCEITNMQATGLYFRGFPDNSRGHDIALYTAPPALESRTVTPMTYFENADADAARGWAWEQVKGEVSTKGWTTSDSVNYFCFFCWGWDLRRQYNEQRTVTVKLYDEFQLCHYGTTDDYAKGYIDCQNNFTKWLAAAGIQVIEGEQKNG